MNLFFASLLQVFLRPLTLGLAYETLRVWFPSLPVVPWLHLWGIVILFRFASGGTALPEEEPERMERLATQTIVVALVRLIVVLLIWAVVT